MPALFDPQPKKEPRFLYDREKELRDLTEHLKDRRWVVVLGPRRIGKTSLANCSIRKLGHDSIVVDSREDSDFSRALITSLLSNRAFRVGAELKIPQTPLAVSVGYSRELFRDALDPALNRVKRLIVLV